jgi:hypothetical protein
MKYLLPVLLLVLVFFSCDKIDELTHFNMDYDSEMTIPATLFIDIPVNIWTPNIPTNSSSTFESNNTHKNLIEEIVLKKMTLTIKTEDASWDFLKDIEIYISAEGVEEKKIAWLKDIPQTKLKSLSLNTSNDDLKEFIKKDEYKLRTKTVTRQIISQDIDVTIKSTFFVDARILGI